MTDSRQLAGAALVKGTITKPDGKAAAGAYVYLQAWPDGETLGALKKGADVGTRIVAKTRANRDGSYELRVDDAAALAKLAYSSGNVDVDLVSADGSNNLVVESFTVRVSPTKSGEKNQPGDVARMSIGDASRAGADGGAVTKSTSMDVAMTEEVGGEVSPLAVPAGCSSNSTKLVTNLGLRQVYVGSNYQTSYSGAKGSFRYRTGAESTIGVGISASGKYGSFSQSGTTTRSSTADIGFGTQGPKSGKSHFTQYVWGIYCAPYVTYPDPVDYQDSIPIPGAAVVACGRVKERQFEVSEVAVLHDAICGP